MIWTWSRLSSWLPLAAMGFGLAVSGAPAQTQGALASWETQRATVLKDSALIAYYDFQEGAGTVLKNYAKTGEALNGKIIGATWTDGRCPGKKALLFGKGNYVVIPHSDVFSVFDAAKGGSDALTIETWVYVNSPAEAGIVDKSSGGNGADLGNGEGAPFGLWINSKKFFMFIGGVLRKTERGAQALRANDDAETGVWLQLAVTVDKNDLRLYKNGKKIAGGTRNMTPRDLGKPLLIGCMNPDVMHFDGMIDEVAIYNRALSADEIMAHFQPKKAVETLTIE